MNAARPLNAEAEPYQTDLTGEQRDLLAQIVARHADALTDVDRAALTLALDKFGSAVAFMNYVQGRGEGRAAAGLALALGFPGEVHGGGGRHE